MYTRRKLLIFNKEPRYKHILIQWQKWLWNCQVPTGLLHLPPRRFSSASHVQCGGHRPEAQLHLSGTVNAGLMFPRAMRQASFFCAHQAYFYPEMHFRSHTPAARPRAAHCPRAASLLLPSPKLSPCPRHRLLVLGFLKGIPQVPKMLSLSYSCPRTPARAPAGAWVMDEDLAAPCSARLWGAGWEGVAADSPGPSTQKLLWGWREEQAGSKDTAERQRGPFRLLSAPSTEGFLPPGSFLGSEGTGYLYGRE